MVDIYCIYIKGKGKKVKRYIETVVLLVKVGSILLLTGTLLVLYSVYPVYCYQ